MLRLFCKEIDPLVAVLKDWLKAEILRVPNGEIKPLLVIERSGQQLHTRGMLVQLLSHPTLFPIGLEQATKEYMADLSGVQSRSADMELGVTIANNFLASFGFNSGIESVVQGATRLSFSFSNVYKVTLDNGLLGNALRQQAINRYNPATTGFFGSSDLLVVDSIITSDNFTIHIDDTDKVDFTINAAEIEDLFKASATLKVIDVAKTAISFKREVPLPFAFTCVKFDIDEAGRIIGMPPARKIPVFSPNISVEYEKTPLTKAPAMIDLSW